MTCLQRTVSSISACVLLLSISCSVRAVDAQTFTPTPAWGSTYVFQEGKSLIVQGGSNGTYTICQTFSIDLSRMWDISNVPYRRLNDGPSDYEHPGTLLQDKQTWFMVSNDTGYEYDISTNSWKSLGRSESLSTTHGLGAATDPSTGLVYIPNGYISNGTVQMARYDSTKDILDSKPMSPGLGNLVSYSIAWSEQVKKMIVYGGAINGTNSVKGDMYTWDSVNLWTVVTQKGDLPLPRQSACMVPAYNGAKMILFGGLSDQSNSVLSDIFILDTATMTWTKGMDAGAGAARAYPACAVSNDQFIAWGGGGISTVIHSNITVVYNIKKDAWQSYYSPNGGFGPGGTNMGSASGTTTSSTLIIIGVICGVVGVIMIVLGILFYRRKRKQKRGSVEPSHPPHSGSLTTTEVAPTGHYDPSSAVHQAHWKQEPWQQLQPHQQQQQQHLSQYTLRPLSMPVSMQSQQTLIQQAPYFSPSSSSQLSPFSNHQHSFYGIEQLQQAPIIFQPQTVSTTIQCGSPESTPVIYDPSMGYHGHRPTVYYPQESAMTVLTPEPEYQLVSDAVTLVSGRPPQNPQLGIPMEGFQEDDNTHKRNPQCLQ
ncbi:hypothetical protein B0O80DRAFT_447697 [Mortierella sp. GBAus27b]|nr:hypothetical protein BGX31_000178 [Mortierella sp. GBA43]KAI8356550.1 hypothetical protein B0O80DRAFT_447697 [Mortierella sp. GBAus27b]